MKLIQQSMLIRDNADNIYAALTSKEDLQHWWGRLNEEADGKTIWYGMDREYEVPIVAAEAGKLISFAFDAHHPYDTDRTEPTTISITIAEHRDSNASVVTVVQSMFSDHDWNTMIHDSWVMSLLSLQLWVERGVAFSRWMDQKKFHTVKKSIALHKDAHWAWKALTHGNEMSEWLGAEASSDPVVGGDIRIKRDDADIEGVWALLSEPRNMVCHLRNASSSEQEDEAGPTTVQQFTILPAVRGSVVTVMEYGHDLTQVKKSQLRRIEKSWDTYLANLEERAKGDGS